MKSIENQNVFITGGLSGIGKACALAAANNGANVAIADIQSDEGMEFMKELKKINPKAMFVNCDVSIFLEVDTATELVNYTFGSIDIALNNAGIAGDAFKVADLSEEIWLKVIAVNLNGVFNCMKHELLYMTKQKYGVIVNIASILGKVGFIAMAPYVAAKHGVICLTQTAALEYASEGIRINAICPGFIETPWLTKAGINNEQEAKQHIIQNHPLNRLGTAEEIANAFIFLASNDSSFMTGATLDVDGGYLAR